MLIDLDQEGHVFLFLEYCELTFTFSLNSYVEILAPDMLIVGNGTS